MTRLLETHNAQLEETPGNVGWLVTEATVTLDTLAGYILHGHGSGAGTVLCMAKRIVTSKHLTIDWAMKSPRAVTRDDWRFHIQSDRDVFGGCLGMIMNINHEILSYKAHMEMLLAQVL